MSKIFIFGDSIAYGKWDSEGGWVARLRKHIDQTYNIGKANNFQVYNSSIPGEVVPRMTERFENELAMRTPNANKDLRNLVIIAAGINDSCPNNWMTLSQTPEKEFTSAFKKMTEIGQAYHCKVAAIGLTPVNPSKSTGLAFSDEEVQKYDGYISSVSQQSNIPKLQLFEELQAMNFSNLLVDVVHPNDTGHTILAEKIIKFLTSENLFSYLTQ